jgi:hypothetical protein
VYRPRKRTQTDHWAVTRSCYAVRFKTERDIRKGAAMLCLLAHSFTSEASGRHGEPIMAETV